MYDVQRMGRLMFHLAPGTEGFYGIYDDPGLPLLERALTKFPDLLLLGHSQPFWAEIAPLQPGQNRNGYPTGPVRGGGRVPDLMRRYPNLGNYGSFFWPLILIKSEHLRSLPIGMLYFDTVYGRQTNLIMAASVMNIIPLIILFVVSQKFIVRGIQLGAVKG